MQLPDPDPQHLGRELAQRPVRREVVGGRGLPEGQPRLVIAVEQPLVQAAVFAVSHLRGVRADPPNGDHCDCAVPGFAADQRAWGDVLQPDTQVLSLPRVPPPARADTTMLHAM